MKDEIEIRAMGFGELAQMYNPKVNPASASNMMRRWIQKSPSLKSELSNAGYRRFSKMLTPRQVLLIVEYLGDP